MQQYASLAQPRAECKVHDHLRHPCQQFQADLFDTTSQEYNVIEGMHCKHA